MTRRIATTLLCVAAVLLFVFNLSLWLWTSVVPSDRFAETTTEALTHDDSREAIAERIVTQLLVDRPILLATAGEEIEAVVAGILGADRFAQLFERLASALHRVVTETGLAEISINVSEIRELVNGVALLLNRGEGEVDVREQPDEIVLFEGRDFPAVRRIADTIPLIAIISGVLAAGLLTIVFVWARDRVSAIRRLGVMLAVLGIITTLLILPARSVTISSFPTENQRVVIGNLFDAFARQLLLQSIVVLLLGAGLFVGAVLRTRGGTNPVPIPAEPLAETGIA
jgi:hypothetical protein